MSGWSVVPAIRVPDMKAALDFYMDRLGFDLDRGGPSDDNSALVRGDARIMMDLVPTEFYSAEYNAAIASRMGSSSPVALYIEASDLEDLYAKLNASDVEIVDPLADRAWGQAEFTVEDMLGNWLTFWKATPTS
jgi:uncharacterized glyoxalase superfamily protein PhnB